MVDGRGANALSGALAGLVALGAAGCSGSDDFARRFDAERARWHADRYEQRARRGGNPLTSSAREALREMHARIEREHGASERPPANVRRRPDAALRLTLAGKSALARADLDENTPPTPERALEYARIARVYGFDPDVDRAARLGEGRTWERLGDDGAALTAYESLLADHPKAVPVPAPPLPASGFVTLVPAAPDQVRRQAAIQRVLALVDLEIHAGIVATRVLPRPEANRRLGDIRDELERVRRAWGDDPGRRRIGQRRAEASLLREEWEEGLRILDEVLAEPGSRQEDAEIHLVSGQVREQATRDLGSAEEHYREAFRDNEALETAAEARLRLANLLIDQGRLREALGVLDDLLDLGARVLEDRIGEVLYTKARCLVAMTRWEDAIPMLARVSREDPGSPFALVAALDRVRRFRSLLREAPVEPARDLVAAAEAVPDGVETPGVPLDWRAHVRRERHREMWRQGVAGLVSLSAAEGTTDLGRSALAQAVRLARERVRDAPWAESLRKKYEERFSGAGIVKETASVDEGQG